MNIQKKIIFGIITLLLIIAVGNITYKRYELKKCTKYGVAKVTGGAGGTGRGASIEYVYFFKKELLSSSDIFDGSYKDFLAITERKEKRYFIAISCDKPTITQVIWDISVPDSLTFVPINGWEDVPYGLAKYEQVERSWWDKIIYP